MIRNFSKPLVVLFAIGLLSFSIYRVENDKLFEISKNIELFINVFKELNNNYVDDLDPSELMSVGINAMVSSLDPFTNYITEAQVERYRLLDDARYQGIGLKLVKIGEKVFIADPLEGGTGHKAGLHAGDEVLRINGEPVAGKTEENLNNAIRGVVGTPVKLSLIKFGTAKPEEISIERGEVDIPNVPYSGFVSGDIGYINLTVFTENASANIKKAYKSLKKTNPELKGLVLDLRYNGGGLLREALSICNIFTPKGEEIVTTRGKIAERDQSFKTIETPEDLDIPIVVLVNKKSASASEIVSGVLQDLDRGVVMGQRTYGKGLVQNTFDLGYNNRIKLTTSKYYIPSGRCIQGVEYKNGEPIDIADSRRSKFKTKNGRTVLDGGGVTPDVKLEAHEQAPFTKALLDQHIIFEYASQYVQQKDSVKNIDNFNFLEYDDFIKFAKAKSFTYKASGETDLAALENSIKTDKTADQTLLNDISGLKSKIESRKVDDFTRFKDQVIDEIEKEIISRYFYQEGKTKISLKRDKEIVEAINLINDTARYKKILNLR